MADEKRARSSFFADALPLPVSAPRDMAYRTKQGKKMHEQNVKKGREDRGKPESRASKCRSRPEQTNYRVVQNMRFRSIQDKDRYRNRTVQGHWCRMGTVSSDLGHTQSPRLEKSGKVHNGPTFGQDH